MEVRRMKSNSRQIGMLAKERTDKSLEKLSNSPIFKLERVKNSFKKQRAIMIMIGRVWIRLKF